LVSGYVLFMRTVLIEPTFESWRKTARGLLAAGVSPDAVLWSDDATEAALFFGETVIAPLAGEVPKVSAAFLDMARCAAAHTDPRKWGLLYRVLWRIACGGERYLMAHPTDPDIRQVQRWCKQVGRGIHKMHAFVRFRLVGTDESSGREHYVSWFEPDYRIVRLASPFFVKRFHHMDWSILTPTECAHWDGESLSFTPGVARETVPDEDSLDALWRTYYRSIFNPARLKVKAMQSEMPKKYWKNLPEASLIPGLIADSRSRMASMLGAAERPVKPAPKNAYLDHLRSLNENSDPP